MLNVTGADRNISGHMPLPSVIENYVSLFSQLLYIPFSSLHWLFRYSFLSFILAVVPGIGIYIFNSSLATWSSCHTPSGKM